MYKLAVTTACTLVVCFFTPGFCQIAQSNPELCGEKTRIVAVPRDMWVAIDKSNASAVLHFGQNQAVKLRGVNDEIREVCPLAPEKLVVLGWNFVGNEINIVDLAGATVLDSFLAYDPSMSPDQHWIASRHFHAPQSQIMVSEEYLLYDLTASASENRRSITRQTGDTAGWAMYPSLPGNIPMDLGDIPDQNRHEWRSKSFF